MTLPGAWGALPPEENSAGFWLGPGGASFLAAAMELEALAAQIIEMLGGTEAVAAALGTSWPAPTGDMAVLAHLPHLLWQGTTAGLLTEAAALISATAEAFETLKAATPTPGEIAENQTEFQSLSAANIPAMGMLTPMIVANRGNYTGYWVTSASNKYAYAAASAAGVQSIPPLPPPSMTAVPASGDPGSAVPQQSGASGGPDSMMSTVMPMLSQLGGSAGQLGSGGGGLSSITGLPTQALQPLMSLTSSLGSTSGADGLDPAAAGWTAATPAIGGPVAAGLSAGGGAAGGGLSSAMAPLRGPVSWSSATINASATGGAESPTVSRMAEARAATATPVGSSGMGGTGGMMGPMAHAAGDQQKNSKASKAAMPLTAAAALYRAPSGLPVITGGSGAVFSSGEGAGDHPP